MFLMVPVLKSFPTNIHIIIAKRKSKLEGFVIVLTLLKGRLLPLTVESANIAKKTKIIVINKQTHQNFDFCNLNPSYLKTLFMFTSYKFHKVIF